jgi:hypothetical protein
MSLAREDALHHTITLREKKIRELQFDLENQKSTFDKRLDESIRSTNGEAYANLKSAYIKLLKKCVEYEETITELYNENVQLKHGKEK